MGREKKPTERKERAKRADPEGRERGCGEWNDLEEPREAVTAGQMRVRVDSEEEGEDSRGIKGGEWEAMHREKEPGGDDEGVDDGCKGRAMK